MKFVKNSHGNKNNRGRTTTHKQKADDGVRSFARSRHINSYDTIRRRRRNKRVESARTFTRWWKFGEFVRAHAHLSLEVRQGCRASAMPSFGTRTLSCWPNGGTRHNPFEVQMDALTPQAQRPPRLRSLCAFNATFFY